MQANHDFCTGACATRRSFVKTRDKGTVTLSSPIARLTPDQIWRRRGILLIGTAGLAVWAVVIRWLA
jgi:hypothetical protein